MSSAKTVFQLAKTCGISEGELLVAFALGFASGEKKRESASSMAKLTHRKPMGKQELKDMFTKVFEVITKRLETDPILNGMPPKVAAFTRKLNEYNVPHGKLNRGLMCVQAAHVLGGDVQQACVVGWCVEWLQAAFLVADDIMDRSELRRGRPCWYKVPGIDVKAINDSWMLLTMVHRTLALYFGPGSGNHRATVFAHLNKLMWDNSYRTIMGQFLDLTAEEAPGKVNFAQYTDETYNAIVKYKTSYYSFFLPTALAMALCGVTEPKAFDECEAIMVKMGTYFQIQDDVLDCYGTPEMIGKVGRDIEENKCGWLVIQALKLVTPAQRKILEDNYAREDPECVQRVKQLYKDLDLLSLFKTYETESHTALVAAISQVQHVPAALFDFPLKAIYKRKY